MVFIHQPTQNVSQGSSLYAFVIPKSSVSFFFLQHCHLLTMADGCLLHIPQDDSSALLPPSQPGRKPFLGEAGLWHLLQICSHDSSLLSGALTFANRILSPSQACSTATAPTATKIRILGKGRVKRRWRSQAGFQPPVHSPCRHSGFVAPQFITRSSHPRDVTLVYHECKATPEISSLQEELCLHLLYDSGVLSFHLASESCFLAL